MAHPISSTRPESHSNLGAPRPKDLERFTTRDRLQYNCWVRDCESIFRGAPNTFHTDLHKVDFAVRFLDETTRSTWDAYTQDHTRQDALWTPTWDQLKAVMLDTLGPESLRRLQAHNELKRTTQRRDQDPNVLLARLNALWSELGDYPDEQRRMDFLSSLLPEIQKEIMLRDPSEYSTVSKLNTLARYHWSKLGRTPSLPQQSGGTATFPKQSMEMRHKHNKPSHDSQTGSSQTRKKAKKFGSGRFDPKPPRKDQSGPKDTYGVCWVCNKPGHRQRECPEAKERPKDTKPFESGKGTGRRN